MILALSDKDLEKLAEMELDPTGLELIQFLEKLTWNDVPNESIAREHVSAFFRMNAIQRMIAWSVLQRRPKYLLFLHREYRELEHLMIWTVTPGYGTVPHEPGGNIPNSDGLDLLESWMHRCYKGGPDYERYRIIRDKIKNRNSV